MRRFGQQANLNRAQTPLSSTPQSADKPATPTSMSGMDVIKKRVDALRADAEEASARAAAAEKRVKDMEQTVLETKHEIDSLVRNNAKLEQDLERTRKDNATITEKLRQAELRGEEDDRHVRLVERERDQWETKYTELQQKYQKMQKEVEEMLGSI